MEAIQSSPLPPPPSSNKIVQGDKLIRDISGSVLLRLDRHSALLTGASTPSKYFPACQISGLNLDKNGQTVQKGQTVAVRVFADLQYMIQTFEDLAQFHHSNILRPLCMFFIKENCHAITYEPITSSLRDFLVANRSLLVTDPKLCMSIYKDAGGVLTPIDFKPLMIGVIRTALMGMCSLHSEKRAHGPFNLNTIMVFLESKGDPVFERPVVKLDVPSLKSLGKSSGPSTEEDLLQDYCYFGEGVLKMCDVLLMPRDQIPEIVDMCKRMINKTLRRISDIERHACLSLHEDRKLSLEHCISANKKDIHGGANFPEGSWQAHFRLILDCLPWHLNIDYSDDFTGFIELAVNIMTNFWEMNLLRRFMQNEEVVLQKFRCYYPLMFIDLE